MRIMAALVVVGALVGASTSAMPQDYPARPIRLVVPYGPGGASDQLARAVGNQLSIAVGQPVIIDKDAIRSPIPQSAQGLIGEFPPTRVTV